MRENDVGTLDVAHRQDPLLEELRRRASRDALSGLLNRATMEQSIQERLRAMTSDENCALFIVDLDNFKQVNDTLGHRAGDQAIRQAGKILSRIFRASDIVGRLGGDEFAIFLCGQLSEELIRSKAATICEKMQLALGDREIVNVTASVGVHLAGKGQEFEGLYQSADLALYKAKKAGKHQYCLKSRGTYQGLQDVRPVNAITLSGLLENIDSGVALLEMEEPPRLIYVSPSFCRIIGSARENFLLPKPLTKFIHPDDYSSLVKTLREGLRKGAVVKHTHRVSGEGGPDWLWWSIRAAQVEYDSATPVMLVTTTDISQFKETQKRQEEQIQRLQTAFDQTAKHLWEVDVPSRVFKRYQQDGKEDPLGDGSRLFPEDLIEGGWVHPDSVARFRAFAQELLGGCVQGFGNFAIRRRNTGFYSWVSISYRMLFDDVGRALRAVGVLEELPQGFIGPGGWFPDQYQLPEGMMADLMMRMRANLALDRIDALWIEGADLTDQVQDTPCSEVLRNEKRNIFCKGEQRDFLDSFDRDRLLQLYYAGQRWLCAEYRRADRGGSIRWVRHILYLTEDPASHHVHLFAYLIRLDSARHFDQIIRSGAQRDKVSRMFSQEAVQRMAEPLFSDRKSGNRAVAVLQVIGLEKQLPGGGADRMRYSIAAGLSLVLGGSCLLGQYNPNQMIAVFPDVVEKEALRRRLEEAIAALRRLLSPDPACNDLRFLMGVDLMPAATANYRSMLAQAARVCAFWWNVATDTVAFAQEREDWDWARLPPFDVEDHISIHTSEMERPLSEPEKDVALDCVSTMLTARTLDASLMGVLQTIGAYYHADRVYTLMLVENQHTVIMTFEWTGGGKRSIQQVVSGMQLERFPLLKQCMEERAPLFLTRSFPVEPGAAGPGEHPWHFTVFPLIRDQQQEIVGFLCMENARKHPADAALFSTLIPFMLQQRERFHTEGRPSGPERLMGLPDLRAYLEALYALNSEHYSSLGVVSLDIPGLAGVNSRHSFEYGSRMLWYVSNTLAELFGPALLFRIREAEWIVFSPNTTREVFLGRCGRLRSILQRRYPKQIRIGRAWADGVFTGRRLASEAKEAMRVERAEFAAEIPPLAAGAENYATVGVAMQDGRFTVYFQPKINLRTGALSGAEALVRGLDEDGTIIPPAQFIEYLEESGMIRDLDLFVLDQSLAQADQWRAAGLGIVPVAVNLSRETLVHPSTLASILAIQSRYPDIPTSALELEITERGGGIEASEFRAIAERFHDCGLRLSLDDFGSQYANMPLFTSVKFDTVKIDRSLILDLADNPIGQALVQDIVQICRTHHMNCVAEGVETREQLDVLRKMDCPCAQGFYYDRPLPANVFEEKYLQGRASVVQWQQNEEEQT